MAGGVCLLESVYVIRRGYESALDTKETECTLERYIADNKDAEYTEVDEKERKGHEYCRCERK